jgi:protein phosphatase 2C
MNVHSVSLKGHRDQNEDQHEIIINTDNRDKTQKNVNFFGVYDGHGGKEISKFIKENLSQYFMDKRIKCPVSKRYVINVYDHIQRILKKNSSAYYSGTTSLTVLHFKYNGESYLNIMNTGDSRCILCRDNFAMPLTKDHKPHWPEEKSRIESLGGKITFDGYDWRIKDLSVSRAFGDFDATPYVTHRPDLYRYKLDKNDKFFVLACDGLWDVLCNHDVINFILLSCYDKTTKNRINKDVNIASKLGEYAIKKGSTDNITIIVIFLK